MVIGTKDRGKIIIKKDMECTITVKLRQNIQVDFFSPTVRGL